MATPGTHTVKCYPEHFEPLYRGEKTYELRKADRPYLVGDYIIVKEHVPGPNGYGTYTLRNQKHQITHILRGPCFGLMDGWVLLSLGPAMADDA